MKLSRFAVWYETLVTSRLIKLRQNRIYSAVHRTLVMLYPFILFGVILNMLRNAFLIPGSYFDVLFKITKWLPHASALNYFFGSVSRMTLGFSSVIAAYGVAKYLVKSYGHSDQLVGLTSSIGFLVFNFYDSSDGLVAFNYQGLGFQSLLLGIIAGFITAQFFRFLTKPSEVDDADVQSIRDRIFDTPLAIIVSLLFFGVANQLMYLVTEKAISQGFNQWINNSVANTHSAWVLTGIIIISVLMQFIGLGSPIRNSQIVGTEYLSNLNSALEKHGSSNVPYPFSGHGIIGIYTNIGGVGSTLALLIVILLISKHESMQRVARQTFLPGLFNLNQPVLVGVPMLFNLNYLLPFLLAPLVNWGLVLMAIGMHLVPTAVYPIPVGTPTILMGFVGTNGSFQALILTIALIVVDMVIYLPFVQVGDRIAEKMEDTRKAGK
ncbi:PTS sugar transporter subunit IIC [Pediococcus argentinicus]|nr:PTS sugar transporter subunit IIC [Pediococcus argentinicus]